MPTNPYHHTVLVSVRPLATPDRAFKLLSPAGHDSDKILTSHPKLIISDQAIWFASGVDYKYLTLYLKHKSS